MKPFDMLGAVVVEEEATGETFNCRAQNLAWSERQDSQLVATVHVGTMNFGDDGEELVVVVEEALDGALRPPKYEVSTGYSVVGEFELEPNAPENEEYEIED